MADKLKIDFDKKRGGDKKFCTNFVTNQYAAVKAGIVDTDAVQQQLALANIYIYESEAKEIIAEQKEKNPDFELEKFVEFLKATGCVKKGEAPKIGQNVVKVDSLERAKQVVADATKAEEFQGYMDQITSLRDKANELLAKGHAISVAIKNPKAKKKKNKETATT